MAELALAIAPLCLGAIKGVRSVTRTLKTLQHHDSKISRLRRLFKVQSGIFLDECQLAFQEFLGVDVAEALVKETDHPIWDDELDSRMKSYFGEKFEEFQATVSQIHDHMEGLEKTLNATLGDTLRPNVKLKGLEHKRDAASLVLGATDYESKIEDLRQLNQELKRIRKTSKHFNAAKTRSFANAERPRELPTTYHQVTQYSNSFYGALLSYWSCLQAHHTNHDVRLLLEKGRDDTSFRVAIHYEARPGGQTEEGLLDLVVSSQSTRPSVQRTPAEELQLPRTVQRRVKFTGIDPNPAKKLTEGSQTLVTQSDGGTTPQSINLCSSGDMCTQLCTHTTPNKPSELFLESPRHVRHYLRSVCGTSCSHKDCFCLRGFGEPAPLDGIFSLAPHRSISMVDQFRLALRLVKGVLQFQSTPWLQPLWELRDLSYFKTDAGLSVALNTVHLSAQLSRQKSPDVITISAEILEAQLNHGIRNLTMHSLGVALLQIGQWNALDAWDIVQIRRLADHESPLGPAYQSITQRCLECDFSFRCGKDLAKEELRNAVYEHVVCELEGLIGILERGSHDVDVEMELCDMVY